MRPCERGERWLRHQAWKSVFNTTRADVWDGDLWLCRHSSLELTPLGVDVPFFFKNHSTISWAKKNMNIQAWQWRSVCNHTSSKPLPFLSPHKTHLFVFHQIHLVHSNNDLIHTKKVEKNESWHVCSSTSPTSRSLLQSRSVRVHESLNFLFEIYEITKKTKNENK